MFLGVRNKPEKEGEGSEGWSDMARGMISLELEGIEIVGWNDN